MALERKDVVTDDALMAPALLTKELEKLLETLNEVISTVVKMNDNLSKSSGISDVKKNVSQLTDAEKEVIKVQGQLSTSLAKSNEEYIEYKRLVNDVNKAVSDKVKFGNIDATQLNKNNASLNQLNLALQKNRQAYASLRGEQERNSKSGKELLKTIQDQAEGVKELNTDMGKSEANVAGFGNKFQDLQKVLVDIPGTLKNAAAGFWSLTKAAVAFLFTPIGIVVAALGAAIFALTSYFKGSEEGQNRLNKIVQVGKAIFEQFMNIVEDVGEAIFDAFTNPKQAISDLWDFIKQNFINRIKGIFELLPALGKAISLAFQGKFAEAGKVATNALVKATLGVENITEKVIEFGKKLEEAAEIGIKFGEAIAKSMAKIDREERKLIVEREKIAKQVAELREKAAQSEGMQRKKYLLEAIALEEQLANREMKFLQEKLNLAQLQLKSAGDDKDALKAVAEATAAVIAADRARYDNTLKFKKQIEALDKEERARQEQIIDDGFNAQRDAALKIVASKKAALDKENNYIKEMVIAGAMTRKEGDELILARQQQFGDDLIQENINQLEQVLKDRLAAAKLELAIVGQTEEEKRRIKLDAAKDEAAIETEIAKLKQALIDHNFNAIKDSEDSQLESTEEYLEKTQELYTEFTDSIGSLFSSLSENRIAGIEAEQEANAKQYETDLLLAGDNVAKKAELTNAFNAQNIALEKKKAAEQRKAAQFDKAVSAVQAGIATALAVTKALPNIPLAIATGIFGAIQIAAILTKQIPAYAVGTSNSAEGLALVGEKGTELKITPHGDVSLTPGTASLDYLEKGTKIIPHDKTAKWLATNSLNTEYKQAEQQTEWNSLGKKIDALNHTIRNKKETHINFSRKGAEAMMKTAESRTWFLNEFYK